MTTIKMAVIGLGKMGLHMIHQATQTELSGKVEIVAVCDSNEENLASLASSHPETKRYTDYKQLLDTHAVDLLYIAVPPKYHYPVVMDALERKIHVFCEKPLANSVEEARAMLEAAEKAGVVHAIHFSMPHEPSVVKLQELIQQETIGEIRKIDLILQFPQWPRAWQQNAWITSREQGGFILEVGIHWIHMIQKVFGSIRVINSQVRFPPNTGECEHEVQAAMELEDGTQILLNGIAHFAGEERVSMVVYGTEGTIALENWDQLWSGRNGESLVPVKVEQSLSQLPVLKHVIARIQGQPAKIYDFNDGYHAQLVLEALRNPDQS
ncbi:MAG TPA: gfo/Idh/MocA family oxidoreductase [Paenibacillus sp.]|uniref:Gfo/Idh/MocA family protein n=1 Tax=Paenibacillus TaxID=44249 RepID=UPI000BA05E98|nr:MULTISPECIES: Gfo/Idh/MocA family oxidoreductase [Paenibacillus]OZQ73081.1 oxidoreductase [Paenibacillus taichungensis]HBU84027.1 gfo/Idh/MocA family oxidoreductase [Paenibacillus sp.]